MATVAAPRALVRPRAETDSALRARRLASVPFLVGVLASLVGLTWDIQWHTDVGPDTFFTAPHLVFYSGVALSGLTCLAVVLLTTAAFRRGQIAADGDTIPVLAGRFRGPAGYVIGGIGAAAFLSYGLLDQWWHGLYGFDVTLVSPPHVGLILSIGVTMVGCLVAFASDVRRAIDRRGHLPGPALGLAAAAAILVAFLPATAMSVLELLWPFQGRVNSDAVVIALLYPAALLLVAAVVRRPGIATLTALVFTLLRLAMWSTIPWITEEYAASIGLFLRDNISGIAILPGLLPAYLLAAGLAVDGLLLAGRRRDWSPRLVVPLAGAVAAFLLRLLEPTLAIGQLGPEVPPEVRQAIAAVRASEYLPTLLVVPVVGALAAWFGWQLGNVLRFQGRNRTATATAAAAAAPTAGEPDPVSPEGRPSWAD